MADQHHAVIAQAREAGADGLVVAERPVAVQLHEVLEDQLDVIEQLRAG
jgi:hypothetical protein